MALSVYETVTEHGRVDQEDLATRFGRRFIEDPGRGYGRGAHELLTAIAHGASWSQVSPALFDGRGSFGNGAAMRVAPLGAFFAESCKRAASEAARSAEITHANDEGMAGAIAVAVAAAYSTATEAFSPSDFFSAVLEHTPPSDTRHGIDEARAIGPDERVDQVTARIGNGSRIAAFDTVPFCLWAASRHHADFVAALWTTVEGLGDRDTTCAIVGGILGGRLGPPTEWVAALEPLPIPGPDTATDVMT